MMGLTPISIVQTKIQDLATVIILLEELILYLTKRMLLAYHSDMEIEVVLGILI